MSPEGQEKPEEKFDLKIYGIPEEESDDADILLDKIRTHWGLSNDELQTIVFASEKPRVEINGQIFDGVVVEISNEFSEILNNTGKKITDLSANLPFKGGKWFFYETEDRTRNSGVIGDRNDIPYKIIPTENPREGDV